MGDGVDRPLTKIEKNNRAFAIVWLVLQFFFCFMYGFYARTTTYNIYATNGNQQYLAAVGIAIAAVIGLGGIMTYVTGLKWSGFGFALLITVLCYQYYFLINAFWTKADVQATNQAAGGGPQNLQNYGDKFNIYLSDGYGAVVKTFGNTACGAFKMALTVCIAFSAVIGRAGPLEILIFVLIGGGLYELNRQIISIEAYDIGGSFTIFMFGGIWGTVVALILSFTRQKQHLIRRQNYTSSRFNATFAIFGSAFFWVFYPSIFLDVPTSTPANASSTTPPFLEFNGAINAYWCMSASVVTSLALSAVMYGRIRIKDLMYGTFAGAAIIGTSAPLIFNTMPAILLGMIAGLLQPLFNLAQQKIASQTTRFSTNCAFVFAVQGFLGSLAAGILRAISDNATNFNYLAYPFPYRWDGAGEFYRACFISFGIALGTGAVVAFFTMVVSGQQSYDFFQDRAYWIIRDDGLRSAKGEVREQDEIKGIHSYLGGNV